MEKQIILPEDVKLTEEVKTLFKDENGKYYLTKEGAQQKLATHFPCKCGNGIREKFRMYCDKCEPKPTPPPFKEWDGKTPLYSESMDRFFFKEEEILDAIAYESFDAENMILKICEPNYFYEINNDYWEDILPENFEELPEEIKKKLDELNEAIETYGKPASWTPSKYVTSIKLKAK